MPHARTIALLALSLCTTLSARAGELMDLWQAALDRNPAYAATRAQADADAAKRAEASALYRPEVTLGADAHYGTFEQSTSGARFAGSAFGRHDGVSFDTRHADALGYGWSLGVQHRLYSADRDAAARRLTTQAELGEVAIDSARQALMLRVTQAYFDLLAAADQVETLEKLRQATRETRDRARARFDAGDAPITDVHDAEARLDLIEAELLVARNEVLVSRGRLQDMTAVNEVRLRRPATAAADPIADEAALAEWLRRADDHNPRLEQRRLAIDLATAEVARLRAAVSPTVDAYARVEGDKLTGDGYGADAERTMSDRVVGLALNVPLWTGGRRPAQAQQAISLERKARLELQAAEQDAHREVREAWLALTARRAQVAALEAALRSAEARWDAQHTGYEIGDRQLVDVLDAEQALYAVRRDLARARYASYGARLALYAGIGELDESRLREVDASLR